jgi:hypothetical protein
MTTTMTTPAPTRTGRDGTATAALLAGPLLLVAGNLLAQDGDTSDPTYLGRLVAHSGAEQASILAFLAGFIALLAGALALAGRVTGRGRGLTRVGAALCIAGTLGFAGLITSGLFNLAAAQALPAATATSVVDRVGDLPAATVLVLLGVLVLPVGFVLLTAGLWRARRVPVWVPVVVLVAFAVLTVLEGQFGGIIGDLLLLAGLGYAALGPARRPVPDA